MDRIWDKVFYLCRRQTSWEDHLGIIQIWTDLNFSSCFRDATSLILTKNRFLANCTLMLEEKDFCYFRRFVYSARARKCRFCCCCCSLLVCASLSLSSVIFQLAKVFKCQSVVDCRTNPITTTTSASSSRYNSAAALWLCEFLTRSCHAKKVVASITKV